MLGLGQKVGGTVRGVSRVIGDNHYLTRPRQAVNSHDSVHQLLGQDHEDVTRSANLVHPGHRFGAVGQGGDGLGAADTKNAVNPGKAGRRQCHRRHRAIRPRRRRQNNLADTGHSGRYGGHQHR